MRKYPSAKEVAKLTKRGRYAVGHNVYLQISEWGTRSWIFRYRVGDTARHMGLGPYDLLTLAEARERGYARRFRTPRKNLWLAESQPTLPIWKQSGRNFIKPALHTQTAPMKSRTPARSGSIAP